MKRIIKSLLCILILMILIILSWGALKRVSRRYPALMDWQEKWHAYWERFMDRSGEKENEVDEILEERGVWISYLEMMDFLAGTDGSEKAFRSFAQRMIDRSKELGFNSIIFQVRPFSDALYDSKIFPWFFIINL